MYAIGFSDDGSSIGITYLEMKITLHNIITAVTHLKASIAKLLVFVEDNKYWAKIFIFKNDIHKNVL